MKKLKLLCGFLLIAVVLSTENPSAFAYDKLTMLNATGKTIYRVYLAPNAYTDWGPDRLSGTWPTGQKNTWDVSGYRDWDLKIVFSNGREAIFEYTINTNRVRSLTIAPNGNGGYHLVYN